MNDSSETKPSSGEARDLLERLAFESLRERRRARRWSIFFKAFFAIYLVVILILVIGEEVTPSADEHTALVEVDGIIAPEGGVSADSVVNGLRSAFEAKHSRGVIVRINSPGGSPVQSDYINREIHRLRKLHPKKPLYAVITDVAASGGYYVAAAADKIYVNPSSIVGSIGVLMNGFGFVETMKKLGVERRLLTAGKYKGMMDPFSPVNPVEQGHVRLLLEQVHERFIDVVKEGRGDRLVDNEDLYTGLIWTGTEARELGLVDEFGSASYVAREVIGAKKIVDYTRKPSFLDRFAEQLGVGVGKVLARTLNYEAIGQFTKVR